MNHQVFEDMLFSGEKPSLQEAHVLHEHLQGCEACRRLSEAQQAVESHLLSAVMVDAQAGFASRWQARLAESQARLHRRQTLAVLAFVIGISTLLVGSLVVLAFPLFQSPAILLLSLTNRLVELVSLASSARDTVGVVFQTAAGAIPVWLWVIIAGVFTQMAVVWLVSYRWLTRPRSVTQ